MINIKLDTDIALDLNDFRDVFKKELTETMGRQSGQIKRWLNEASYAIIYGLINPSSDKANVKINGKSLGKVQPDLSLYKTAFAKYVLSKSGAGELGIPDPVATMKDLEFAILDSFKMSMSTNGANLSLEFNIDLNKVLSRTPHPGKMFPNGQKIEVDSWLQWVTGPNFNAGVTGFGLAKVGDLRGNFQPRTLLYSGSDAGVMLSIRSRGSGKSPYEALTGITGSTWKPIQDFKDRFWESWIQSNSQSIKDMILKVFQAILEEVIGG